MMADNSRPSTFADTDGLLYAISPKVMLVLRLVGIGTLLMVILAFIFCIVQAEVQPNNFLYLLAFNMLLSCFIGGINAWWYKNGHLTSDKYWYVLIVAAVIIWQCVATDIYAFHSSSSGSVPHNVTVTTVSPSVTSTATMTSVITTTST